MKYLPRPQPVDAFQMTEESVYDWKLWPEWLLDALASGKTGMGRKVDTGQLIDPYGLPVNVGAWVVHLDHRTIQHIRDNDLFQRMYEPAVTHATP